MKEVLERLVYTHNDSSSVLKFHLVLEEVDVLRGGAAHDLSRASIRSHYINSVKDGDWDLVLCAPPCETWSRVLFKNRLGPSPGRSRRHPWGIPAPGSSTLKKIRIANTLIRFTFEVLEVAQAAAHDESWRKTRGWLEHPEDLGDAPLGSPASIFQLQRTQRLVTTLGYSTGAFYQCWVAPLKYAKPTRVIYDIPPDLVQDHLHQGWPSFVKGWRWGRRVDHLYRGPLPNHCGHHECTSLGKRPGDICFRTTGTAAYHPEICAWIISHSFWISEGEQKLHK